jgi:hypothetical protein
MSAVTVAPEDTVDMASEPVDELGLTPEVRARRIENLNRQRILDVQEHARVRRLISADRKRKDELMLAAAGLGEDERGSDGIAMIIRPNGYEEVATGKTSIGREKAYVRRYQDEHLIDRMKTAGQLTRRQHEAAHKLLTMWTRAGLNPAVCASYGERKGVQPIPTDVDPLPTAEDRYRKFAQHYAGRPFSLLEAMLLETYPGTKWLATVQSILNRIADDWKLDRP